MTNMISIPTQLKYLYQSLIISVQEEIVDVSSDSNLNFEFFKQH